MGDLGSLFSLAYDRGGKVVEMIHNRLGPDRFFAFFRKIYHDYAWKTFRFADLKRELIAFDPAGDWDDVPRRLAPRARRDRLGRRARPGRRAGGPVATTGASRSSCGRKGRWSSRRSCSAVAASTTCGCRSGPTGGVTTSPARQVAHVEGDDRWVVTRRRPVGADAGRGRPRPRPARRGPRQQPLEDRGLLAVHAGDDAARRVVAVRGVRPALGRRRPVRRPVRAGRLQGRRAAGRPLAGHRSGRGPSPRSARRSSAARPTLFHFPWPKWTVGPLLRGRALQLLQRQAALGRPGVPALPVPPDVELPHRRPGVRRALFRDGQRVLGGRQRPARQRLARRGRRPVPAEHALPLLGPGAGPPGRGHRRARRQGVRLVRQLLPDDRRVRDRPAVPRRLGPSEQEPPGLPGLRRVLVPRQPAPCSGSAAAPGSAPST